MFKPPQLEDGLIPRNNLNTYWYHVELQELAKKSRYPTQLRELENSLLKRLVFTRQPSMVEAKHIATLAFKTVCNKPVTTAPSVKTPSSTRH